MKKALASILSIIMLLFLVTTATANEGIDKTISETAAQKLFDEMVPEDVQHAMEAQIPALKAYQKIIANFDKDEFGVPVYPDGYAGEYIDDNNQLVILVTPTMQEKYSTIFDGMESVIVKEVKYSYSDLKSLKAVADEMIENGISVIADGIDVINNTYFIDIEKDDLNTIKKDGSLSIYMSELTIPLRIEEGEPAVATTSLWGGDRLTNSNGFTFSLGICGTYNGSNAILTCGHGNENRNIWEPGLPTVYYWGDEVGPVVYQQCNQDSGNYGVDSLGDFAIVQATNDTMTNYVHPGLRITGTYSSVPVGTTVYKYGTTTGYTYGSVTVAGIRRQYVDPNNPLYVYYVSGLYEIYMSSTNGVAGGDSGGPVWRVDGSSNLIHGIVSAGSGDGRYMYSTPIYYAQHQGFNPRTY